MKTTLHQSKAAAPPDTLPILLDDSQAWADFWNDVIRPKGFTKVAGIEALVAIYLDGENRLIEWALLGIGMNQVIIDTQAILAQAEALKASAVGLIHNHPSGNLGASQPDLDHFRKLREVTKPLDLVFHDSVIVTDQGHTSIGAIVSQIDADSEPAPGKVIPFPAPSKPPQEARRAPVRKLRAKGGAH